MNLSDLSHHLIDWVQGHHTEPASTHTLTATAEPPGDRPVPDTVKTLEARLSEELHRLQLEAQQSSSDEHARFHILSAEEQEAARVRDRDEARDAMRQQIYDLHTTFGTGLSGDDLDLLRQGLQGHEMPTGDEADAAGVEKVIERAVCQSLLRHAGHLAWERLVNFMQTAGVAWPPYPEMTYGRSPDEAQTLLEAHHQEIRARLCTASVDYLRDVMIGEIRAWSDFYPTPDGRVWKETCLTGVAAALQIQVYSATLALWLGRPADLQESIVAELQQLLSSLREASEHDAARLCKAIMDVASTHIPDLVWRYARPQLVWEPTAARPRTIRDLAADLLKTGRVDSM